MAATFSRWKSRLPPPLRSRPHCEVSTSPPSARLRESRRLHCCSAAFVASSYRQLRPVSHARDPEVVTLQGMDSTQTYSPSTHAPPLSLLAMEPLRALFDYCAARVADYEALPVGDGHPVVVYPGLAGGAM